MSKINSLSQHGFTIIEIMIAITVFAIGLIGINILQTTSIKGNAAANRLSGRTNWASTQIENLEQSDYTTTDNGTDNSSDGRYTANWTVDENATTTGTKTIKMTVCNKSSVIIQPPNFKCSDSNVTITWIKGHFN